MSDDWQPLAGRARLLFHLQALVSLVFFRFPLSAVVGGGLALWTRPLYGAVSGALLACFFLVSALWMPSLRFDRWHYLLREDDLLLSRGVFVRRVTSIPYSRVQHVDVQQGLLERWFGLARVIVSTASGIGGDGMVPGLDEEAAEGLRDALVERGGGDDGL